MGAKIVLIKMGTRGGYLRTSTDQDGHGRGGPTCPDAWRAVELWAPCFQVEVANAVGAGDAAVAGFLTAMLSGLGPQDALLSAMAVGACNVEQAGGSNGVMPWQETQARIAMGWTQRVDCQPDGASWHVTRRESGMPQVWVYQTSDARPSESLA